MTPDEERRKRGADIYDSREVGNPRPGKCSLCGGVRKGHCFAVLCVACDAETIKQMKRNGK